MNSIYSSLKQIKMLITFLAISFAIFSVISFAIFFISLQIKKKCGEKEDHDLFTEVHKARVAVLPFCIGADTKKNSILWDEDMKVSDENEEALAKYHELKAKLHEENARKDQIERKKRKAEKRKLKAEKIACKAEKMVKA